MVAILFLISLRPAAALANSDANYRVLRDAAPAETYRVENIELRRDVGTLTLRAGQITFLTPVLNPVSMAVFNGEGRFQSKPAMPIEERYIEKLTRKPAVDENPRCSVGCVHGQHLGRDPQPGAHHDAGYSRGGHS